MTLADYARQIGISPSLARQWKRRGKIVERDSGFELVAQISADGLILPGVSSVTVTARPCGCRDNEVCDTCQGVTGAERDRRDVAPLKCDSVTVNTFDHVVLALSERITQLEVQRECRDLEDECQWQTIQRLEGEIAALQTEVAFLRTRIADQPPATTRTVSRGGPIDLPGPQWGA